MQKRLKRIFAFICAFALLTTTVLGSSAMRLAQAADTDPTPVELEGFETVTVEDFQDSAGTEMESKEYAYDAAESSHMKSFFLKEGNSFNKKLLSMNVKFTHASGADPHHSCIMIGADDNMWNNIWVYSSTDGSTLNINRMTTDRHMDSFSKDVAGVTSFENTSFLLQMSFEDTDAGLVIGVYVNGTLCGNLTWTNSKTSEFDNSLNLYREKDGNVIAVETITDESIPGEIIPVELPEFETVTVEDFQDSAGTEMESKEYAYDAAESSHMKSFFLKEGNSFNKKLLSMYVKFTHASGADPHHSCIMIGADDNMWNNIWVYSSTDGSTLNINRMTTDRHMDSFSKDVAGVTSFENTSFLLQMSFEDTDAGLVIGVYVNGTLCGNLTWTNSKTSEFDNSLNLYREKDGNVIAVETITDESIPGEIIPVELPEFETVTVEDFQDSAGTEMESKTYAYDSANTTTTFSLKDGTNFNKKLISMNVKFESSTEGMHARIVLGNSGDIWNGLWVFSSSNGTTLHIYEMKNGGWRHMEGDITSTNANVTSFMNTEFLLQLSLEDTDGGLVLGVYVDGELCQTYTWADAKISDYAGSYMNLYRETAGTAITVGSISEDDDSQGPETDEPGVDTPTVYTDVTFQDFGIENDIYYSKGSGFAVQGALEEKNDLDKIALSGDILLTGESTDTFDLMLGSKNNDVWSGIKLWINGKTMTLNLGTSTNVAILDSEIAGVGSTFANNKFTLKWSVEFVCNDNDNQYNDVKVGLWFNGNLYEDSYFTISNGGTAAELGKSFAVCCESGSSSITINPDDIDDSDEEDTNQIQPNDDFTKLTFAHFGIKDNTYKYNGDLVVKGNLTELATLDQTVLYGNVLLEGEGSYQLIFGGKEDGWDGIRFIISDANSMSLEWFGRNDVRIPVTVFNSMVAGVDFVGEAYDLAVSTELIEADEDGQKNDIQFGFWFNGKLYDNSYVVVKDQGATLGNRFAAYCSDEDSTVTLNSDPDLVPKPKQPNDSFEKITFEYFDAADGTYKYNGTDAPTYEGKGRDTMNEKVFCGDFLFNGVGGNQFMIGGDGNTWYGLCFIVTDDNKIALLWIDEEGAITVETYDELTAGTHLVGEWLNLMISTEIVDADGDGAEDDIQLGVWFNGALYKEAFSTILNKASGLGDCFGMYSSKAGSSISIRSIPEYIKGFDYAAFGLTKDWEKTLLGTGFKAEIATGGSRDAEPFTGDLLKVGKVCLFSVAGIAAVVAGIYTMLQRKKES